MKSASTTALTNINQKIGEEPIILLKLELGGAVGNLYFADRTIIVGGITYLGRNVSIGGFTNVRNQNSGSINGVAVSIIDNDLKLLNLLNSTQIAYKKASLFLSFGPNIVLSDLIPLIIGQIATPISWKENDRTLNFEVNTAVRGLEVGYTPLDNVQQEIIGKTVPLCYGTVFDIPAVMIVKPRQAKLYDTILASIDGVTGTDVVNTFRIDKNDDFPIGVTITLLVGVTNIVGHFDVSNPLLFIVDNTASQQVTYQSYNSLNPREIYITKTPLNLVGSQIHLKQHTIFGGSEIFDEVYTVLEQTTLTNAGVVQTKLSLDHPVTQTAVSIDDGLQAPLIGQICQIDVGQVQYPAGLTVYQVGFTNTVLACNAIPTSSIISIRVYHTTSPSSQVKQALMVLDSTYYTVNLNDNFNGYPLTTITLPQPLAYYNQGWSDVLYVSLVSSVGPNTADIISDVVTRYTALGVDPTTFKQVHDYLVKYPSNFAIFNSPDALSFIGEICWQSRCAYYISNGTVFLRYLSIEPNTTLSLTDSDIEQASIEFSATKIEDIVTELEAHYKLTYAPSDPSYVLLFKNNVSLFGLKKQSYDFFIYTDQALVQKSLIFWGNRYSNQWKEVSLKGYLKCVLLDIFDCVSLKYSLGNLYTHKTIVDEASYDSAQHTVTLRFWTPILLGTNSQSSLAWLSDSADPVPLPPARPPENVPTILILTTVTPTNPNTIGDTRNATLGIITNIINLGTGGPFVNIYVADIYDDGYDQPSTEQGVYVKLLDTKHKVKLGQKVLCTRIGNTYYNDNTGQVGGGLVGIIKKDNDDDTYQADIYDQGFGTSLSDDLTDILVTPIYTENTNVEVKDQVVIINVGNQYWFQPKPDTTLAVGETSPTEVSDSDNPDNDNGSLDDIFQVVNGKLCIRATAPITDGTIVAPMEMVIDNTDTPTFRPSSTLLKD